MTNNQDIENRLGSLLEGIQVIDFNWRFVYLNNSAVLQSKYSREELIGFTMMEKYDGIENSSFFKLYELTMADRQERCIKGNEFRFDDGTVRWYDLKVIPVDEGICILSVDITPQIETQENLRKSNNLYAFLAEINQKIPRIESEEILFRTACEMALEFGNFKMAWIGLFNFDNHTITLTEQCGLPEGELWRLKDMPITTDSPHDQVLKNQNFYISNDILNTPDIEIWKTIALLYGINSCIVLPIRKAGLIIGTFNLYSEKLNFSYDKEIELLLRLSGDISFAIDNLEKNRKHVLTEALVINNEKLFRHTLDNMLEGAQIHDFNWRYTYVNDAMVSYNYYKKEELIGYTFMEKYPGVEHTELFQLMTRCMHQRTTEKIETEFIFPNGDKKYFELSIQPIPEGIFILSVDHTEQKIAQDKILKLNRLYAFISAINQSIVHLKDRESLLQNACTVATEIGEFKMAWIGMFQHETKSIALVAQSGIPDEELPLFSVPYSQNGPQDLVLNTGVYYQCEDIFTDPKLESWRPFALKHGIMSFIILPIIKKDVIVGTFNLYSQKLTFADDEEVALLKEVTSDIAFALEIFKKAKKHDQTEALLIENERRFRALIEKSPDMKTLSTSDGILIYGSPATTKILGYTSDEYIGTSILKFIVPEYIASFLKSRETIIDRPGEYFDFELPLIHKDGHYVWCKGTITNMMHEPAVGAFVANFQDIADRKAAEQQLQKSEAFNRQVLNSLSAHIAVIDSSGEILMVNDNWKRFAHENNGILFNVGDEQNNYFKVCQKFFELGDHMALEVLDGIKSVIDKRQSDFYIEYPCDGVNDQRWFSMLARHFEGDDDLLVIAHNDISQRKFAEEMLIHNNQELVKTNFELDRFVYSVSHDLRSPLTSILGLVNIIEDETREPDTLLHTEMIKSRVNRLDDFIKNILSYSRSNRILLEAEALSMEGIVKDVINSLETQEYHNINFEVAITCDFPFYSERQSVVTILENLISNAIKFHDDTKPNSFIKVSGTCNKDNLYLIIADNGIGIKPIYLDKIFDMFFRLSGKIPGTGIGLYIVKGIVEKLGGSIIVESEFDQGTVFHINIKNQYNDRK